jgi:hypothetical protein
MVIDDLYIIGEGVLVIVTQEELCTLMEYQGEKDDDIGDVSSMQLWRRCRYLIWTLKSL